MTQYTAVVERDADTGLYVGYVPGFPGAHTQAASLDELNANLREVIAMLLEDGDQPRSHLATNRGSDRAVHNQ
jgi:predicted RNase H-like HicB family nuclease